MGKRGHYDGAKRRGGHTSIIPIVEKLVKEADALSAVVGIAPGFINSKAKSRVPRIEFKIIPIGLEVVALGNNSKQSLMLYTSKPELVKKTLEQILK
ncbi:MAG: hypothetical protein M3Q64_03665 [bacterium]|nr:hypothetical protein [bacterium]